MDSVVTVVCEWGINLIEAYVFYYLIFHCLNYKYKAPLKYLSLAAYFVAVCICNSTVQSVAVVRGIMVLTESAIAVTFAKNSMSEKIFWGSSYTFITLIAENCALIILQILEESLLNILTSSLMRYFAAGLYLLLTFLFVYMIARTKKYTIFLPKYLIALFFGIVLLGIMASQNLVQSMLQIEQMGLGKIKVSTSLYYIAFVLILALLVLFFLMIYTGRLYMRNIALMEKSKEQQIEQNRLKTLTDANSFLRVWKHENVNHLLACCQMLDKKKYTECREYLSKILHEINYKSWNIDTGNEVIDAILTVKLANAKEMGILPEINIILPRTQEFPISDIELSSILGNALDNALEACKEVKDRQNRYLRLMIKKVKANIIIEVENSSSGVYRRLEDGTFCSTKDDKTLEHGIGLKRVKDIVTKARGFYDISSETDKFVLTLVIPLEDET